MRLGSPRRGWMVTIARDWWTGARFAISISVGVGFIENHKPNEIPWRHHWRQSSASLPALVFRKFYWRGVRLTLPIGFRAFGRYRIFWGC